MKKCVSLSIAVILVFVLAVPAFALEPETQVIDLGTVDLGNGVSYHTVLTIENPALRASVKKGSITRDFSYYGAAIGSVQLNGFFHMMVIRLLQHLQVFTTPFQMDGVMVVNLLGAAAILRICLLHFQKGALLCLYQQRCLVRPLVF